MAIIDETFTKDLGERLKELREKLGLTQEGLAEKVKVDVLTVSRWERGETLPKVDNIVYLSDFFGVTTDYILYGKETSDDNSFTWYDNFKRLNRLIYSMSAHITEDNNIVRIEFWEDEAKVYYEKVKSFSLEKNYKFENRDEKADFSIDDLDNLFCDYKKYTEQLVPVAPKRVFDCLKKYGENPEEFTKKQIKKIRRKRKR